MDKGGVSKVTATVKPGKYTYFCDVRSHEAAGMKGTLTVPRPRRVAVRHARRSPRRRCAAGGVASGRGGQGGALTRRPPGLPPAKQAATVASRTGAPTAPVPAPLARTPGQVDPPPARSSRTPAGAAPVPDRTVS